ncbi:MAG TPA: hypothetical protein VMM79_11010 [Longimicrobiales bacterium]|nr:hypothetical protein [Longimicrobiales bacterium]
MYGRFLAGLRAYLRNTITVEQARASIAHRLAGREEALLRVAERGFFGHARSPYTGLLAVAGCGYGDFRTLVRDRGIEVALRTLREAGVYFTFEEFKGRQPVVRAGREIAIRQEQFDNPYLSHYYGTRTGGSTGSPSRVSTDLTHLAVQAEQRLALMDAHGVLGIPFAIWRPPLPSGSGINSVLRGAKWGRPPDRWFTPLIHRDFRPSLKFRLANSATIGLGRLYGADLPWPEAVPLDRAIIIAEWMAASRERHGSAVLNTTVSNGVRIAVAAREAGLDLAGTTLYMAGEPLTLAKAKQIADSGARVMTDYGAAESGRLGLGCALPSSESDVHVAMDTHFILAYPREVPNSGEMVTSFHITSIHPSSPKMLLNVEFDDCGVLEERSCGCPLGDLGLTTHLRSIRSFGKLVGEGVSLLGSEMSHILEDVLPARFGGSSLDYQLEESDDDGYTRLTLVVSPRVTIPDEAHVIEAVLQALREISAGADVARAFWQEGQTFRVRRGQPYTTSRGKQSLLVRRSGTPEPTDRV